MSSFRQIEADRSNACPSTGPVITEGKRRLRQNALRDGVAAEAVIDAGGRCQTMQYSKKP